MPKRSRFARKPVTRIQQDPDYYLHGRERRIRRESWEWPENERHPEIGISRGAYWDGWQAGVGSQRKRITKTFADSKYGGSQESLEAAIAWRQQMRAKLPLGGGASRISGWKLAPEKAGSIFVNEQANRAEAYLTHDGARCFQTFAFKKWGGKDNAVRMAELALEIWREEAQRIAALPRREQERIARKGGWTNTKGFPANPREQMELPLNG